MHRSRKNGLSLKAAIEQAAVYTNRDRKIAVPVFVAIIQKKALQNIYENDKIHYNYTNGKNFRSFKYN